MYNFIQLKHLLSQLIFSKFFSFALILPLQEQVHFKSLHMLRLNDTYHFSLRYQRFRSPLNPL